MVSLTYRVVEEPGKTQVRPMIVVIVAHLQPCCGYTGNYGTVVVHLELDKVYTIIGIPS